MDRARYLVDTVVVEGRGVREVARSNGVSKSWLSELVGRFRSGGYEAVAARSKRPHRSPQRIEETLEDEIVGLRKGLSEIGLDAGPRTIAWHLERRGLRLPAESTISRVLVGRGSVTPRPRKRPRSSYLRFEAALRTSAGSRTSPTGGWQRSRRSPSSTSSTTTRGSVSPPSSGPTRGRTTSSPPPQRRRHLGLSRLVAHGQWRRLQHEVAARTDPA